MEELSKALRDFSEEPVVFISLSAAGKDPGSDPTTEFLKYWRDKFKVDDWGVSTVVAASPRNPGQEFYDNPRVPNMVVIDKEGKLAFKKIKATVKEVVDTVKKLL